MYSYYLLRYKHKNISTMTQYENVQITVESPSARSLKVENPLADPEISDRGTQKGV